LEPRSRAEFAVAVFLYTPAPRMAPVGGCGRYGSDGPPLT
jgi:hypothetical protein